MKTLLSHLLDPIDPLYVSVDFSGTPVHSLQVPDTATVAGTIANGDVPLKMEHAWFLCTQSFQLARINTRLDFVFIGEDFYRRITSDLLAWLTARIEAAIAAGRSPELIEKSGDLLVEAVAQSGIEPSNELPEGYRPPRPWIPPLAVRAMSEAMRDYPLPTEGECND